MYCHIWREKKCLQPELIADGLYLALGPEDLKQNTRKNQKRKKGLLSSKKSYWAHQSIPEPNQIFSPPEVIREQRSHQKSDPNMITV